MTAQHQTVYDEKHDIVRQFYAAATDVDEIMATIDDLERIVRETGCGRVLVKLVDAPTYQSQDTRKRLADRMKSVPIEKEAIVTANAMLRMVAKAIHFVAKTTYPVKFFKDEEPAIAWLSGESKR